MRKIAFMSDKGGVGKSTACLNIGAALADMGRRVLVVDLDGNACVSRTLLTGVTFGESVGAALVGEVPFMQIVHATEIPNLWLAPGTVSLRTLHEERCEVNGHRDGRFDAEGRLMEMALSIAFAEAPSDAFHYSLLDCPGGHPFMERAALMACDDVVIPVGMAVYDLYALEPTVELIVAAHQARKDGRPRFIGYLPNAVGSKGVPLNVMEALTQYALPVFSPIRHSAILKSAPGREDIARRVVVLSRAESAVAESIRRAAREIDLGIDAARAAEPVAADRAGAIESQKTDTPVPGEAAA